MPNDVGSIVTQVTNISGKTRVFGYLPPHGKELDDNEVFILDGDLKAQLRTGGRLNRRQLTALQNDIDNDVIRFSVDYRHVLYGAVLTATVISEGDLVYVDSGNIKPASDFSWNSDLATTQADFANLFLGVAMDDHVSGAVSDFPVNISDITVYKYACTSETHALGDTMGPAKNPSTTALLNQKLENAVAASSIARVIRLDTSAATNAIVRFQSAFWGQNAAGQQ